MLSLLNDPDDALLVKPKQLKFVKLLFRKLSETNLIFSSGAK